MSDHKDASVASEEVRDLLAELNEEFGKKPRAKKGEPGYKELNTQFHMKNPRLDLYSAKNQLAGMKFENYYDWEMHRQHLLDLEATQESGEPTLQWLPEARVTYIINQTCACCKDVVQFVGREYVRFRGRRRNYRTISGEDRWTWPTQLIPVHKVDGSLLAFGMPGGDPLPDLSEELEETVSRCAGCISLERKALDLWIAYTQPSPQEELNIDIPLSEKGL